MVESGGFIKLHRSLLDWEWFNDANAFRLFVYCLIKANYTDTKWRGIDIQRGTFITSIRNLSYGTGLSIQQVRTSIDKLTSTGEITSKPHSKYSVITINNYSYYQGTNTQNDTQVTKKEHSSNKEVTTDKKEKNTIREEKKNRYEDYVLLSTEEHNSLIAKLGSRATQELIERLDEYVGSSGKRYKSHYKTILTWHRRDVEKNPKWLAELKEEQIASDKWEHQVVDKEKVKKFKEL